jgi:hypothetical protein
MVVGIATSERIELDAMAAEVDFASDEPSDPFGVHCEAAAQQVDLAHISRSPYVDGLS